MRDHRSRLSGGVHYAVLVDSWSGDYSFGLNRDFDPLRCKDDWDSIIYGEPFEETRSLVFKGRFLEPPRLKEEKVEVRLRQRAHLNEDKRSENLSYYTEHPPKAVGSLHKEKPFSWCSVSIPEDSMNLVLEAASANKIKFITLYGEKLRYRKAYIFSFSLREKLEDDE